MNTEHAVYFPDVVGIASGEIRYWFVGEQTITATYLRHFPRRHITLYAVVDRHAS
jgi:hypothetical protein